VIQPTRTAAHAAPRTIASLVASTLACTLACATACTLTGCSRDAGPAKSGAMPGGTPAAESAAAAPTNRVDIPDAVRRNLGVVFAKVESRAVARTLRVPGRFELLPTAGREYRAPLAGRVELLVAQYQRVELLAAQGDVRLSARVGPDKVALVQSPVPLPMLPDLQ
jgi:hypothetical protein